MYKEKKIGVGIITYNRPEKFFNLYKQIKDHKNIDQIVIIKNKDIDYKEKSPQKIINEKTKYFNILGDVGVGACKNQALRFLLQNNCDHIFLIEDDIRIKNYNVFKQYINTAEEFDIGHLNFCGRWMPEQNQFQQPYYTINSPKYGLEFYTNLCGFFEYFTKEVLLNVGLMDERYINALQHAEHTFRICQKGYYVPGFHAFADIKDSQQYLEDLGKNTTIENKSQLYKQRLTNAFNLFKETYGFQINQIGRSTNEQLMGYFKQKQIIKQFKNKDKKIGLCCIACLQDNYIDEWIQYHLKMGFDQIFIYQNNWRAHLKQNYKNVHLIEWDGINKQRSAYEHCIQQNFNKIDFLGFWDVDEFLYIKQNNNIKSFMNQYLDLTGIGINWRTFGDNNLTEVKDNNYSVIQRFTRCENKLNHNVKIIINCFLLKHFIDMKQIKFTSPHSINLKLFTTNRQQLLGPWNENLNGNYPAEIYHYILKTKQEYIETKMKRGNGDNKIDNWYQDIDKYWSEHNHNDIENNNLIKFMEKNE